MSVLDVHRRPLRNLRCRSPTAATCAAPTACRRRTTSGCRARTSSHSRRSTRCVDVFVGARRATRSGSPAASRCCAATCPTLVRMLAGASRHPRSRAHHQRRAARRRRPKALQARRAAPLTVSLDTLRARALQGPDALRRARPRCSPGIDAARRRLRRLQDRHRGHPRRQRRRALPTCWSSRREVGAELRFIEYMDVGGATRWTPDAGGLAAPRCWTRLAAHFGAVDADRRDELGAGRALPPGRRARPSASSPSTTAPFCEDLRSRRLTADGMWLHVPVRARGIDLRGPLRGGARAEVDGGADHRRLARTHRSRRRAAAGHARAIAADSGDRPQARPASGDAHPRGIDGRPQPSPAAGGTIGAHLTARVGNAAAVLRRR